MQFMFMYMWMYRVVVCTLQHSISALDTRVSRIRMVYSFASLQ